MSLVERIGIRSCCVLPIPSAKDFMHQPRIMYSRSFSKVARLLGISVVIALPIGVLINSLRQVQISDSKPIRPVVSAVFC